LQHNFKGHEDCGSPFPMLQTGSGKSVFVSEGSVQKARAVLEEEGDANRGILHRCLIDVLHIFSNLDPIFMSSVFCVYNM
jgi:hypothetical protein